jgi:hypothetical protein
MPSASSTTQRSSCGPRRIGRSPGRSWAVRQSCAKANSRETWDAVTVEPIGDFIGVGDRVAVRHIWHGVGHGPESHLEFTAVYTIRKGKISMIEYFWDHAEVLEALGLSEQDAHAES